MTTLIHEKQFSWKFTMKMTNSRSVLVFMENPESGHLVGSLNGSWFLIKHVRSKALQTCRMWNVWRFFQLVSLTSSCSNRLCFQQRSFFFIRQTGFRCLVLLCFSLFSLRMLSWVAKVGPQLPEPPPTKLEVQNEVKPAATKTTTTAAPVRDIFTTFKSLYPHFHNSSWLGTLSVTDLSSDSDLFDFLFVTEKSDFPRRVHHWR